MANIEVTTADALMAALQAAKGGETIAAQGAFGVLELKGIRPASPVTIDGAAGAHFERISMLGCANLHFTNLSLWPLGPVVPVDPKPDANGKVGKPAIPFLFGADETSDNIELSNSILRGRKDSDGHAAWGMDDWMNYKIGGVLLMCRRGVVRSNKAIGVYFGFTIHGESSELFDNRVFGFSADGLRVGGDNSVVIGNRVSDGVRIDGNHPDGIQAFKRGGLLRGIVIKDNVLLEWTVRGDNPLRAKLQGVGLYDGPYADLVIRDNKVANSSPNGVRVNDCNNVSITGNHVRHIDRARTDYPRIMLTNCTGRIEVSNNQAEKFVPPIGSNNTKPDYNEVY